MYSHPFLISLLAIPLMLLLSVARAQDVRDDPAVWAYFQLRQFSGQEFDTDGDGNIWKIHFRRKSVYPSDIKILERLADFSHLYLDGSDAGDEILEALSNTRLPNLTNLGLEGCLVTDAGMTHLGKVKQIKHLDLAGTLITDRGLRHLKDSRNLLTLNLTRRADTSFSLEFTDDGVKKTPNFPDREKVNTQITGAGLKHLSGLTRLYALYLDGAKIDDDDLQYLARLDQIESLDLSRTSITDAGLVHLKHMKKMDYLRLDETRITDDGLKHLEHMIHMDWISLGGTRITNDGLKHLKNFRKMKNLTLANTKVTNEGLQHIAHLSSLQTIFATDTALNDSGVEYFRKNSNYVTIWKE